MAPGCLVGTSRPIMLQGCRCASLPMRAEFLHPKPARVLAMATVSGTRISAHFSRECASSSGGIRYRRTLFLPSQRIVGLITATNRASRFHISRTLRVANCRAVRSSNFRSEVSNGTQLEKTEVSMCTMVSMTQLSYHTALLHNPSTSPTCCLPTSSSLNIGLHCTSTSRRQLESSALASSASSHRTLELSLQQSTSNTSRDVSRSDAIFMGGALPRLAGILVGSALLIATLGLGFTRPALARPSTVETSSNVLKEELDSDETTTTETALESESTPSQPTKEEEKDPAELVLLSYLGRHPEDVKAQEGLLYIRLRKGSIAKALETVDNLLALRPDHAPWQLIRAQALEFLGDLEGARHAFELILEKDPLSARALQGLATVMSKAGEGTEMLEMLRRAVQSAMEAGKTKEAKNLRMLLGQMYTLAGNLQEALAQYQELEREDPRDFRPYLCQGLVYSLLDQKADAERAFLKYRKLCPKSFPERGYLDDLMIGAKTEARKIQAGERLQPQGKKKPKPLQQPNIATAVAESWDAKEE